MTGIICVNKGKDITSFGVVSKVRGITGEKKAGHTGTLDPMATGVLPVMLGGATRFLNYLPDSDKGYRAKFVLGKATDTLDITGNVIRESAVNVTYDDVKNILPDFLGEQNQIPPMYSAKSVDGKRLYELARQGIEIEREPCPVNIKKLELADFSANEYTIDVLCSKGTYIRSLIDDIGKALGCGAVMTALTRTNAMGFGMDQAVKLEELQRRKDENIGFDDLLFRVEDVFSDLQKIYISNAQAKRFSNGGALDLDRIKKQPDKDVPCCVYCENLFLGLGQSNDTELSVLRLLTKRD